MSENKLELPSEMARKCFHLGIRLLARRKPAYTETRTKIQNLQELIEYENKSEDKESLCYDIDLTPSVRYKNGLVVIDIEHMKVWDGAVQMEKEGLIKNVIMKPSIRGGHMIFQATFRRKSLIKATLNMGIQCDYLTNKVRIIAPGKYISKIPNPQEGLSKLPYEFDLGKQTKKTPIVMDDIIKEGSRNQTLFVGCNQLKGTDIFFLAVDYLRKKRYFFISLKLSFLLELKNHLFVIKSLIFYFYQVQGPQYL